MAEERGNRPGGGDGPKWSFDVREAGRGADGEKVHMDRRLFMQLLVYRCSPDTSPPTATAALGAALQGAGISSVLYADTNDPMSLGLLTWSEDPAHFVEVVRPVLVREPFRGLELRSDFTMLGRTYSIGYEEDLPFWLIQRPQDTVLNEDWPWAVWYPLRRSGAFARLEPREQASILREHGVIGKGYGSRDLAHDVRLACHGLDANDNEFVIGLLGRELHPLSHLIQAMRRTRQTSEFIEQMGPFFVGRAVSRTRGE